MQELVERTFNLAHLMCIAAGKNLYTTIMVADRAREVLAFRSGWAGELPKLPSRASYIGPMKAFELLHTMDPAADFAMTPTPGFELGCGYMGGVRRKDPDSRSAQLITSGSAWSERCDAMMALLFNYAMINEVRFHHVGFRHSSLEKLQEAVDFDEKSLGVKAFEAPAEDHIRYYLKVEMPSAPNGVYWMEHQYFPEGNHSPGVHWDLVTTDPTGLLDFVGGHLNSTVEKWDAGENDPVGSVWEKSRDYVMLGLMARPRWWKIN